MKTVEREQVATLVNATLPKTVGLPPLEAVVLIYSATRKSSYNGKDRYDMANGEAEWGSSYAGNFFPDGEFPPREDWNAAKSSLIDKGLLNKRGAVTLEGKNAAAQYR